MGNRLSKIVTRTGDDGTTGLANGDRVSKADDIIEAIGAIDELNSCIGIIRSANTNKTLESELISLQHSLFNCGGDLCLEGSILMNEKTINSLEESLQKYNDQLAPLTNFILPSGSEITSRVHMARSICRRAERRLVKAIQSHTFNPLVNVYINRLSDWLFVVARITDESRETLWC